MHTLPAVSIDINSATTGKRQPGARQETAKHYQCHVEVLDHYMNVARSGNKSSLTVTASSYNLTFAPLVGVTEVPINQKEGRATFYRLIMVAMPGTHKLKFKAQMPLPLARPHTDLAVKVLTCSDGYNLKSLTKGYRCRQLSLVAQELNFKRSPMRGLPAWLLCENVGSAECARVWQVNFLLQRPQSVQIPLKIPFTRVKA